jgi:hypothetical protein
MVGVTEVARELGVHKSISGRSRALPGLWERSGDLRLEPAVD